MIHENIVPIATAVSGLITGVIGAYIPRAIEAYKAKRNENRLDTVIVTDNLQKIIDDLRAEQRELKKHHEKCLQDSTKQQVEILRQTHEIKILWHTVKQLREEVKQLRQAHDDSSPKRILPPESTAGS